MLDAFFPLGNPRFLRGNMRWAQLSVASALSLTTLKANPAEWLSTGMITSHLVPTLFGTDGVELRTRFLPREITRVQPGPTIPQQPGTIVLTKMFRTEASGQDAAENRRTGYGPGLTSVSVLAPGTGNRAADGSSRHLLLPIGTVAGSMDTTVSENPQAASHSVRRGDKTTTAVLDRIQMHGQWVFEYRRHGAEDWSERLSVDVTWSGTRGDPVTVSVAYEAPVASVLAGWLFPESVSLRASATMRQEFA